MDTTPDTRSDVRPVPAGPPVAEDPDLHVTGRAPAGRPEHETGRTEHAAEATLAQAVKMRAIGIGTMSGRLRLVTGLAIAQTLAAGVFLCLRGTNLPTTIATNIANDSVGVVSIPTVALWVSIAFLALAWAYVLAAAFDSAWPLRLSALALFSGGVGLLWLNAGFSGGTGVAEAALLGAVWVAGIWSWRGWKARAAATAPERPRPRAPGLFLILIAAGGIYALFWFGPSANGPASEELASAVFEQIGVMALILVPALLLAGSEFGEWGEVIGDRLVATTRVLGRRRALASGAIAVAVAGAVLGHVLASGAHGLWSGLGLAALVAAALGGVVYALRSRTGRGERHAWPHQISYVALALVAVGFYLVTSGDLFIRTSSAIIPSAKELALGGNLVGYGQDASPAFGIKYPSGWTVQQVPPDYTIFNGGAFGSEFVVLRVDIPADRFTTVTGLPLDEAIEGIVQETLVTQMSPQPTAYFSNFVPQGSWTGQLFALGHRGQSRPFLQGIAWERVLDGRVWVLYGTAKAHDPLNSSRGTLFRSIWQSWTADPSAYVRPGAPQQVVPPGAGAPVYALGAAGLAAIAALLVLLLRRRRLSRRAAAGWILVLAVAGLYLASGGTPEGATGFPFLHVSGIQAAVAIGTIGTIAVLGFRRKLDAEHLPLISMLLMVNVALQLVAWLFQLFGGALAAGGQFSVVQAIVVLAALAWELLFSGINMTNGHSTRFPRHARVLAFCGYIMLVATSVLFFSSLHVQATGSRLEPVFESEVFVQRGLVVLAIPLVLAIAVVRLLTWLETRNPAGDEGAAAAAVELEVGAPETDGSHAAAAPLSPAAPPA